MEPTMATRAEEAELLALARDPSEGGAETSEATVAPTVLGTDPSHSILWGQVRQARPQMWMDQEQLLRPDGHFGPADSGIERAMWSVFEVLGIHRGDRRRVWIGDLAAAILRAVGPHDPPMFEAPPGYDEQRWRIRTSVGELTVHIESRPYWGFGLFAHSFLNRIGLIGPLDQRSRLAFEVCAILGRRPWEPTMHRTWVRHTGADLDAHRTAWQALLDHAEEGFDSRIEQITQRHAALQRLLDDDDGPSGWDREAASEALVRAVDDLESARQALRDRASHGVERALGRIEGELNLADPATQVTPDALREPELTSTDISVQVEALDTTILDLGMLPAEPRRSVPAEMTTSSSVSEDTSADHLLENGVDETWDPEAHIPFVDLTAPVEEA